MRRKILIVRRENIGDLILTTPLIHALRVRHPDAYIAALVNSYNAPVLAGNSDLEDVYVYTKGKHSNSVVGGVKARLDQARLLWRLRQQHYDDIVLAEPTYVPRNIRLARFIMGARGGGTRRIIGFEHDDGTHDGLDVVASKAKMDGLHQAQIMMRLAEPFGVLADEPVPMCRISATRQRPARPGHDLVVGLHISARKPSQQWSVDSFAALAQLINARVGVRFKVFWSPGNRDNVLHPGDDEKAIALRARLHQIDANIDATFVATTGLADLIAALDETNIVVCADGGAMHIAAGLGKPVVALFGDSDPVRWRPWGVPHQVLQRPSCDVGDITPEEVLAAFETVVTDAHADHKYQADLTKTSL